MTTNWLVAKDLRSSVFAEPKEQPEAKAAIWFHCYLVNTQQKLTKIDRNIVDSLMLAHSRKRGQSPSQPRSKSGHVHGLGVLWCEEMELEWAETSLTWLDTTETMPLCQHHPALQWSSEGRRVPSAKWKLTFLHGPHEAVQYQPASSIHTQANESSLSQKKVNYEYHTFFCTGLVVYSLQCSVTPWAWLPA